MAKVTLRASRGLFQLGRATPARTALLLGSALGVSMAVFTAAPRAAHAQDECGPIVANPAGDSITCTSTSAPFPNGITYDDTVGGTPADLTVTLDNTVAVGSAATPSAAGLTVFGAPGYNASAVIASGATITTDGNGVDVRSYGYNAVSTYAADTFINNGGTITTTQATDSVAGTTGIGISGYSQYGSVTITDTGKVTTVGDGSIGVLADGGLNAYVEENGTVSTSGAYADGVQAYAFNGNAAVTGTGSITTTGDNAFGIFADGYNASTVDFTGSVTTSGAYAHAVVATSVNGPTTVTIGGAVDAQGYHSDGVYATSTYGQVAVNVSYTGSVTSASGDAIFMANGVAGSTSTLTNDGVITGGLGDSGYAVDVAGYGSAVIVNNADGLILGPIALTAQDDVVTNYGQIQVFGTRSDFGAGNDTFNNAGVLGVGDLVTVASGPHTSAVTAGIYGLETFNNGLPETAVGAGDGKTGIINLANGYAGDVLTLASSAAGATGAAFYGASFYGTPGYSVLNVDTGRDTAGGLTVDKLVIGAADGQTNIFIAPNTVGTMNFTGVTVVDAQSATSPSNFVLGTNGTQSAGFVDYLLRFDPLTSNWNLFGLPSTDALSLVKATQSAQNFWYRSANAYEGRLQELRDSQVAGSPARASGWELWLQGYGGADQIDDNPTYNLNHLTPTPNVNDPAFILTPDLTVKDNWRGIQVGFDNLRRDGDKYSYWGFTGGFLDQETNLTLHHNTIDLHGWNVGAYGGWNWNGVFLNALLKGDLFEVDYAYRTLPFFNNDGTGSSWGVQGELGYRWLQQGWFIEPVGQLSWVRSHLQGFDNILGANADYKDGTSFRGQIGARAGMSWGTGNMVLTPYLGVYGANEWRGRNTMTFTTGDTAFSFSDDPMGTFMKVEGGFTAANFWGLEGFVKGTGYFLNDVSGWDARAGVRWRW